MRPARRNTDDRHLRELERRVLEGDLTAVSALARAYERVARGEPPPRFAVLVYSHRHGQDVSLHPSTADAKRAALAIAYEWWNRDGPGGEVPSDINNALNMYQDASDEHFYISEHGVSLPTPMPPRPEPPRPPDEDEPGEPQRCQGRLGVGPFERQCEGTVPCTFHEVITSRTHDPECTRCEHDCPWLRAHLGTPYCAICDDHNEAAH